MHHRPTRFRLAALGAVAALALAGCANQPAETETPMEPSSMEPAPSSAEACAMLAEDPGWYADNREKLNEMIASVGECGGAGDVADGAPLALFDWDNTVVKNDIGDATTFWMLANGHVLQPADWTTFSAFFTPEAGAALTAACGALAEPGQPLPTNTEAGMACADEIVSVYSEGTTTGGDEAFGDYNARRVEPQYAFAAQLLAGYTEDEATAFAAQARTQNLAADEGTKQMVGSTEVTGWVRYYDQVTDLIEVLQANGFDVRVVSASAEPVVRAWADELGIGTDKVMGVKMQLEGDKMTSTLVACGGDEASMTYIEGKRCRVNEEIYGITGPAAFETAPEGQRPAFGAGDSDTDISFMVDSTEMRLVINRNKTELMCHAYDNEDGKWIINPMFIDPKGQQDEPYKCSTAGEIQPDGSMGPLNDMNGNLIDDQADTVFGS